MVIVEYFDPISCCKPGVKNENQLDIVIGPDRTIYLLLLAYQRILVISYSDEGIDYITWGGPGHDAGEFYHPSGIAIDKNGNIYIADTWNSRIQKFSSSGVFVAQWGTGGSSPGQFGWPDDVAVDGDGNMYVADTQNHRIQKLNPQGMFKARPKPQ